jgi:hypothetical protein
MELGAGGCMVMDRWSLCWELIVAQKWLRACCGVGGCVVIDRWLCRSENI